MSVSPIEQFHLSRTFHAMVLLAIRPRSAPELAGELGVHRPNRATAAGAPPDDGYVELSGDRRRRYGPTMRIVALAGQVVEQAELT